MLATLILLAIDSILLFTFGSWPVLGFAFPFLILFGLVCGCILLYFVVKRNHANATQGNDDTLPTDDESYNIIKLLNRRALWFAVLFTLSITLFIIAMTGASMSLAVSLLAIATCLAFLAVLINIVFHGKQYLKNKRDRGEVTDRRAKNRITAFRVLKGIPIPFGIFFSIIVRAIQNLN